MTPLIRIAGALALGAGAAATFLAPTRALTEYLWGTVSLAPAKAEAEESPVLLYRDPMGGLALSRAPKKDAMGMDYLPVRLADVRPLLSRLPATPSQSTETPLFWRDPMGGAEIAVAPKKDSMGMAFLPVRAVDLAPLLPPLAQASALVASSTRRVLYYRNPMGLPDTSPTPKKDPMGMDYLPVYAGDASDAGTVKLTPARIQRSGVRFESVAVRPLVAKIFAPGSIELDERRVAVVATRSDAYVESVADVTTGDLVKKGQTLLKLYSPEIAAAGAQYLTNAGFGGARQRLENLAVPDSFFATIERTHTVPMSVEWPAPRDGVVLERSAVDGMKAPAGQPLFRIADVSRVWALLDIAERDFARIAPGQRVVVRARALPGRAFAGTIESIYPQVNKQTRAVSARVELDNADLVLRPDMYVDAEIAVEDGDKALMVSDSAVIASGARSTVILDKGDGRFEAREVKIGRRGEGFAEIRSGLQPGDKVVTVGNFLIDAESNLKAALNALGPSEDKP